MAGLQILQSERLELRRMAFFRLDGGFDPLLLSTEQEHAKRDMNQKSI